MRKECLHCAGNIASVLRPDNGGNDHDRRPDAKHGGGVASISTI